jgi:DNA-binding response OmpR family regulator
MAGDGPLFTPDPPTRASHVGGEKFGRAGASRQACSIWLVTSPEATPEDATVRVLVYSDDLTVRTDVRAALGRRPAADLPMLDYAEVATEPAVIAALDKGGFDLVVLDGEAVPAGGLGICRQLKDEIYDCPPVLVLTGRPDDAWLATWSRAESAVPHPLDPRVLAAEAARLLRVRLDGRLAG